MAELSGIRPETTQFFESTRRGIEEQNLASQQALREGNRRVDQTFAQRESEVANVGRVLNERQQEERGVLDHRILQHDSQLLAREREASTALAQRELASDRAQEAFRSSLQDRRVTHDRNISEGREALHQRQLDLERQRQERAAQFSQNRSVVSAEHYYPQQQLNPISYPSYQGTRGASSATRGASSATRGANSSNRTIEQSRPDNDSGCVIA